MTPDHILTVSGDDAGARLDTYISKMTTLSRSAAQGLLEDKRVTVNGKEIQKSCKLKCGDVVEIFLPEPEMCDAEPEDPDAMEDVPDPEELETQEMLEDPGTPEEERMVGETEETQG